MTFISTHFFYELLRIAEREQHDEPICDFDFECKACYYLAWDNPDNEESSFHIQIELRKEFATIKEAHDIEDHEPPEDGHDQFDGRNEVEIEYALRTLAKEYPSISSYIEKEL